VANPGVVRVDVVLLGHRVLTICLFVGGGESEVGRLVLQLLHVSHPHCLLVEALLLEK